MRKRGRIARQTELAERMRRLACEVERLVPEIERVIAEDDELVYPAAAAARSLERAASAARVLVDRAKPDRLLGGFRALLEGTSPLMSMLGSRVVLAPPGRDLEPRRPSAGAQALALLLEEPSREFGARRIADRLGWSVPIARTTLNRLVASGHARRVAPGRFRAKKR